jgi:phosphate starvation-inducible protein PhoH
MGRKKQEVNLDPDNEQDEQRRHKKILTHQLKLNHVSPLTPNQKEAFHLYFQGKNLVLHGVAGTGKSFIALYFGLNDLMKGNYEKIVIVRSAVATRDVGFLPGNLAEKLACYEAPYQSMCAELFSKEDAYTTLKNKKYLEFISTSFLRGITLNNSLVIVDEFQNMNYHELSSIFTRIGNNSRVILCGDVMQSDLDHTYRKERSGAEDIMEVCERMGSFGFVDFEISDIVRSGFVREFILASTNI